MTGIQWGGVSVGWSARHAERATLADEMTAIILGIVIGAHFFLMLAIMTAVAKWRGPGTDRTIILWIVFLLTCVSIVAFALIALGIILE